MQMRLGNSLRSLGTYRGVYLRRYQTLHLLGEGRVSHFCSQQGWLHRFLRLLDPIPDPSRPRAYHKTACHESHLQQRIEVFQEVVLEVVEVEAEAKGLLSDRL